RIRALPRRARRRLPARAGDPRLGALALRRAGAAQVPSRARAERRGRGPGPLRGAARAVLLRPVGPGVLDLRPLLRARADHRGDRGDRARDGGIRMTPWQLSAIRLVHWHNFTNVTIPV